MTKPAESAAGQRRRTPRWPLLAGGLTAAVFVAGVASLIFKNTIQQSPNADRVSAETQARVTQPDSRNAPRVVSVWIKDDRSRSFVARADLDSEAFQAQFDECTQDGLRPICINGYVGEQGETRYAGVWIDDDPPTPFIARRDMNSRDFQRQINELPAGYYPIWLDVYGSGAARRFAAIWVHDGRDVSWQAASLLGAEAAQQQLDEMAQKQFRPAIVSGHTGPTGVPLLTLAFVRDAAAFRAFPQLTFDNLKETIDGLPAGWRPIWVDVYPAESSRRYAVVCIEDHTGPDWKFSSAPSIEEYQTQFEEQVREGYRPLVISVD